MNKSINIICLRYYDGGAEINRIIGYANGFSKCGCKVNLFFMLPDNLRSKLKSWDNVNVINLWEGTHIKNTFIIYLNSILRLWKKIAKNDNCFLYYNSIYTFLPVALVCRNITAEVTEHPFFSGKPSVKKRFFFNLKKLFWKRVKNLLVISNPLKNYFIEIGFPANRISIINMFVDSSRFNSVQKISCKKEITYCGTLSYGKDGVDILIRSFKIFSESFPEYTLKLIGRGIDPQTIPSLKKLCSDLGINEKVEFPGSIKSEFMPQMLKDASILALARPDNLQAQNGFPTKLGEYLCTGNPVVVTSVGDIPLFIKEKENGILACPDDPVDFAEKLLWLARNPDKATQIGEQGKLLADNEFSSEVQSRKVFNLIYG